MHLKTVRFVPARLGSNSVRYRAGCQFRTNSIKKIHYYIFLFRISSKTRTRLIPLDSMATSIFLTVIIVTKSHWSINFQWSVVRDDNWPASCEKGPSDICKKVQTKTSRRVRNAASYHGLHLLTLVTSMALIFLAVYTILFLIGVFNIV